MTEREDTQPGNDELTTMLDFIEYHRQTFAWKCEGLDAEQLARRSMPPSTLSLLGLLRHLADVERAWFDRVAGRERPKYYFDGEPSSAFRLATGDPAQVAEAWANWHEAVADGKAVAATVGLDDWFESRYGPLTIRWLYAHLLEEYARHNGHADLLREAIDGATGE
jgi:uncharacterized damage-inducible protein DinB